MGAANMIKGKIRASKAYYDGHEEEVQSFLRANDPLFLSKQKNKLIEYPYLSKRQQRIRQSKEIQESCLSGKQSMGVPKFSGAQFEDNKRVTV